MRNRFLPLLAVTALIVGGWTSASAAEELLHGRISFADGGGLIKGASDDDWSYATLNTLVLPNDTVWADQEGTVELELPSGSFLRMADGSKAEFVGMSPDIHVRGWTGSFYVQRISRSTGEFVFESPAAQIRVDGNSQVRVDIVGDGSTTVSVRWGRALLTTPGESVPIVVSEGQRVYVDPGLLPSSVVPFDRTGEDAFDVWNRERAKLLAVGYSSVPTQISDSVIGVSDLNNYGEWVSIDSQPYWRPTVVVDYVPYRSGYWSYAPSIGYSWIADYPFGYITSHYGRWTYHNTYGWCWGYRPGWSSAWVASVRYGPNFVWSPIGFDGYPVYHGGAHFSVGGVRFGLYTSSYCGVNDLFLGPARVFPVRSTIFGGVHHTEINIWNINIWNNRIGRDILPGATLRVRDYSPRRVIRGPDIAGPRLQSASARIASLESSSPRGAFDRSRIASVRSTGGRDTRTALASENRGARPREAHVRESDLQQTRDTVRRVLRQDQDVASISGRSGGSGARSARVDIPTVTSRGSRSSTGLIRAGEDDSRLSGVPRPDDSRSAPSARVPADAGTRTTAPDSGASRSRADRVTTLDHGAGRGGDDTGRGARTMTRSSDTDSGRTVVPGARGDDHTSRAETRTTVPDNGSQREPRGVTRSETPTRTAAPERAPSTRVETQGRSAQPRTESPSRTSVPDPTPSPRVETPGRSAQPRTESPSRTSVPDPTPSPRVESPSRSAAPRTESPSRTSVPDHSSSGVSRSRGSRSESRMTAPRETTPPRQTYSRSATTTPRVQTTAPRQSAPTRSYSPPASSQRSVQSPSRSYSPPQASSPSSRSYSPPPSSDRSVQAPSRSIERSAPSISSSRGSSSPSLSTRSSGSSSPSFSAPSGGGRGSGGAIGGSHGSSHSSRGGGRNR